MASCCVVTGAFGGLLTDLDHAQLAFWKVGDLDLLDSHSLAGTPVEALVYGTEGTFANAVTESL